MQVAHAIPAYVGVTRLVAVDNAAMSTPSFTETVHAMLYRMAEYASYNLMEDAAMLAFIFS